MRSKYSQALVLKSYIKNGRYIILSFEILLNDFELVKVRKFQAHVYLSLLDNTPTDQNEICISKSAVFFLLNVYYCYYDVLIKTIKLFGQFCFFP